MKFPAFYGTQRFITTYTSARHLSPSCARSIQSIPPHPTSWRYILILPSHLCLGLPSGLFPLGFPTQTHYTPLLSPIRAAWPSHLVLLDFITRKLFGEQYRSLSSSLCSLLHSPVTSSLLAPNILLNTVPIQKTTCTKRSATCGASDRAADWCKPCDDHHKVRRYCNYQSRRRNIKQTSSLPQYHPTPAEPHQYTSTHRNRAVHPHTGVSSWGWM